MMINRKPLMLILAGFCSQTGATDAVETAVNVIEPPMVTIPAGEFLMGGAKSFRGDEIDPKTLPIHKVSIKSFKAAKYEVTVKEFRQFIEATGYKAPESCYHQPNEGWFSQGSTKGNWENNEMTSNEFQPVVCIDWEASNAYAEWLSKQSGKNYRMLSEAEWEYAARGGATTKFYFGDDLEQKNICEYANVSDISAEQSARKVYGATYMTFMGGIAQCDDGSGFASVVGMYKPNAYGLYDMIGNVVESVQDCGNDNYQGAPIDGSAWLTGNCENRVGRGGGWHWRGFSSNLRGVGPASWVGSIEGFRLAQDISNSDNQDIPQSTVEFEKALARAQETERKRRDKVLPIPARPTGLTLRKNSESGNIELSWKANADASVTGYNVYRSLAYGARYIKIADNINQLRFIDKAPANRKQSYVIAASNADRLSQYSDPVSSEDSSTNIPGIVQAEDYNSMHEVGIGTIADEEDEGGGLNLTGADGLVKDSWTEYLIEVKSSGIYQLKYRVASAEGSDGFELLINDKVKTTQTVPATGGWRKWQTATGQKIHLAAGQHKLRMRAIASGWKLNWLAFEPG